jgi:hypothetical protein
MEMVIFEILFNQGGADLRGLLEHRLARLAAAQQTKRATKGPPTSTDLGDQWLLKQHCADQPNACT